MKTTYLILTLLTLFFSNVRAQDFKSNYFVLDQNIGVYSSFKDVVVDESKNVWEPEETFVIVKEYLNGVCIISTVNESELNNKEPILEQLQIIAKKEEKNC